MKGHTRIQIIGNDLNIIRHSLNRAGIYTEDIIRTGNPLGFVSLSEDRKSIIFPEYIEAINNKVTQLTLRKNLNEYLSHDENIFKSNEIKPGVGKTVRHKNTSSYVIICNTNLVNPLFSYKGNLYSGTFPENEFSEYLKQQGAENVSSSLHFNAIRKYFDKYIEILLKEYSSEHIILVKTVPSLWYLEQGTFKLFNDEIVKIRKFIHEADNYFIKKTHCAVVATFERFMPGGISEENSLPGVFCPDFAYDQLSIDIISAIQDNNIVNLIQPNHITLDKIIEIFMLTGQSSPHNDFHSIATNLLHNKNCSVVAQSFLRYKVNKEFLNSYPYFQGHIPDITGVYIRLSNEYIMGIFPEKDVPFQLIPFSIKDTVDEDKVIENGFCCSIHEAEALCKSMKFYVQRAKRGGGNRPIKLQYETKEQFIQSMFFVDYEYLMSNEPFLIGVDNVATDRFSVRTNLEFLFREKTRIVRIQNGLTDQITQYLLSKCIQYEGMDVYYDDLHARSISADHQGYELNKVINERIDEKCFSNILSNELVKCFDNHEKDMPDVLFEAGAYQLLAVSDAVHFNCSGYKKCSRINYAIKAKHGYENIKYFVHGFGPYVTYYFSVIRPEILMLHYPLCLNQLFRFPAFEDKINSRIEHVLTHSTVVGVHIRRGDYTVWGKTDSEYYKAAIRKVTNLSEYREAKLFVFSDDIPWCKANAETLGLLQVGKENLTYVSHNKGDDSFRDMQLLSLCKVIIGQQGGFARMAHLLSNRSEMFVTPEKGLYKLLRKIGRGNKYDIESI